MGPRASSSADPEGQAALPPGPFETVESIWLELSVADWIVLWFLQQIPVELL
jgi:hypothetical protein